MSSPHPLLTTVRELLAKSPVSWPTVLERVLAHFECSCGTIHLIDPKDGVLHLTTHRGLPPPVIDKVQLVPIGKGMAGLAAERKQPVQVCNLQSDTSVFGIAKPVPYEFTADEQKLLMDVGALVAKKQLG
jgi:L-methionine (R)-S-oxide reductase